MSQEGIPPGYAAIPLIEALNGKVFTESGQSDGMVTCYSLSPFILSLS